MLFVLVYGLCSNVCLWSLVEIGLYCNLFYDLMHVDQYQNLILIS